MPKNPNFQPRSRVLNNLTLLSVYIEDTWKFYDGADLEYKVNGPYTYATLKYKTGLLAENETDPAKYAHFGVPGDYIFFDQRLASFTIIKREDIGKYVQIPPTIRNPRSRRRRI